MGQLALAHTGSWTTYTDEDLDETNVTIKLAPGHVGGWYLYNDSAAVHYVLLYDALIGDISVGTTVPKFTIGVPAGSAANLEIGQGVAFETAISAACTTDFSTGAPATNDCVANILYY